MCAKHNNANANANAIDVFNHLISYNFYHHVIDPKIVAEFFVVAIHFVLGWDLMFDRYLL